MGKNKQTKNRKFMCDGYSSYYAVDLDHLQ